MRRRERQKERERERERASERARERERENERARERRLKRTLGVAKRSANLVSVVQAFLRPSLPTMSRFELLDCR